VLEESLPSPLTAFASATKSKFTLIHNVRSSWVACQPDGRGQQRDSWQDGSRNQHTERRPAQETQAAVPSPGQRSGSCGVPGGTRRPKQHSSAYVPEAGIFCPGEPCFLKSKQLREVERRICNTRLKSASDM